MARIRSAKPELRTSRVVASWPREVRYFFVLLWGYLDDKGRGLDIPKTIAGDCFPYDDDITATKIDKWLDLMAQGRSGRPGPVCRYEVDGVRYLHCNFGEHQRINRPTPSRLPPCPLHDGLTEPLTEDDSEDVTEPPPNDSVMNSLPGNSNMEKEIGAGEVGAGEEHAHDVSDSPNPPPGFDAFWENYPRKVAKAAALRAWPTAARKLAPDRLAKAAAYWADLWRNAGVGKEFIPHPATWLNGERWNDEPPVPRGSPQVNGHRPSTADQAVRDTQALKALYRNETDQQPALTAGGTP